ncbi:MAG: beta-ketoacyl-ACP synthase II [Hydrotalea sp.]|nr:beta-ketoacyl-ACP synthase II [Hydrotalea sp.]
MSRRVVVTGMGIISPLGLGVDHVWQKLIAGTSGIGPITRFDASAMAAKIAGEIPRGSKAENKYDPSEWIEFKEQKKMDPFIQYGYTAATMAVEDAGLTNLSDEEKERAGVMVGSGIGGLPGIEAGSIEVRDKGPRRLSPFFIPANLVNLIAGFISIKYGWQGPNHAVATACASSTHAIGDSMRFIRDGYADIMLSGGAEAAVCAIGIAGFCSARALSTKYNDQPEKASRPWDKDRDGFVMGEGSGMMVLEEYEHAKKRGAKIYAEVVSYGLSGDAHHLTAPPPDGNGGFRAMRQALAMGNLDLEKIDYINAHGTSTPLGDEIELRAVKNLFKDHAYKLAMSSTKSATGHLLGGAGAIEAIFTIKAIQTGQLPPTLNLDNPSEGCDLNLVAKTAQERKVNFAMSNSFGFGGTNASVVFGAV